MTDAHLSERTLDALALGALDPAAQADAEAHLAGCAACRATGDGAAELRDHFTRHVLPRGLPVRQAVRWPWLAVPMLVAATLAITLWPRPPDLAVKGDASWQVFANRDGQTFAVHDGAALAAGDRIRFAITAAGARYLLVASVDGRGAVTIYLPYGGVESALIGSERFEPEGSIVLDDAPGPERLYAVFSDEPIAAALIVAQLRAVAAGGASAIRGTTALALSVPVRTQTSVVFEKAVP